MRRILLFAIPVLVLSVPTGPRGLSAAQGATKTARGTVTAMAADSVTVRVRDSEMKFNVDAKTTVIAPGAGTASRRANAAGKPGPKLADVVSVGKAVQVSYHEMGATLHASRIQVVASAGPAGGSSSTNTPATRTASGTVKSVAAGSLTITSGGKDMTFAIDASTNVVGRGAGTAARVAGGRTSITTLVGNGDTVGVSYHAMAGSMHAAEVRVTAKAAK